MRKMQAGMGDVVFTPLYEVLRRRGVQFRFFHEVTRLGVAPDDQRVETIEVVPQLELLGGAEEYLPLADVRGLPCWPNEPLWDQLEADAPGHDFELLGNPLGHEPLLLRRGEDFDAVVLGIPVGALEPICAELMERDERFRRGIERAVTVRTEAFQVWANRDGEALGWEHGGNSVAGCYVEPIDTYCDMTHLIPRECWTRAEDVRTIGYFCGVLEDRPGETHAQATARVRRNAIEFLRRDMSTLWPAAVSDDGEFDWSVLVDPDDRPGAERFEAQYWRANVAPSERYVLTPAGSVEHRLASDDSGFENLALAGDWTRNGIDGGCVEAAVISGIEAASAIAGEGRPIPGRGDRWLRPRSVELPGYVEFGGRATATATVRVLARPAAQPAPARRREPHRPAGGANVQRARRARRGVPRAQLARAAADRRVRARLFPHAPLRPLGGGHRDPGVVLGAAVAGRRLGGMFTPERVLLAVPYIFVDNPMSYLGGREAYGYAKTMGRFSPGDGLGGQVKLEAFGGDFGRDEGAGWQPFLGDRRGRRGAEAESDGAVEGPEALVRQLTAGAVDLGLAADLMTDMFLGRQVGQVFLKQFRDAADGTRSCYQSVVGGPHLDPPRARAGRRRVSSSSRSTGSTATRSATSSDSRASAPS